MIRISDIMLMIGIRISDMRIT
eukprot:COSAG01_NODE_46469_length_399_cov_320.463333_1_plen_21_part_01